MAFGHATRTTFNLQPNNLQPNNLQPSTFNLQPLKPSTLKTFNP
ncbi:MULTISPECIES: hypothetical protein [unclassified Moorena]|nr:MULTISPECIES: hypothetical protein [unclassified Moorena]